ERTTPENYWHRPGGEWPTPEIYRHWPSREKLGKTIKVWKFQTKKFPEVDLGMVADPYGFEDSPDAEVIASGLNSKGPYSVALSRHGNFFQWGFSAQPSDMTPEARNRNPSFRYLISARAGAHEPQTGREQAGPTARRLVPPRRKPL